MGAQRVLESERKEGVEGQPLAADGAHTAVVEAVEVHGGEITAGVVLGFETALAQAFDQGLGCGEQSGIRRDEGSLARAESFEEWDQGRPMLGRDGDGGAHVEQGGVVDDCPGANRDRKACFSTSATSSLSPSPLS